MRDSRYRFGGGVRRAVDANLRSVVTARPDDVLRVPPKPGGGIYSFTIPGPSDVWLDPLYDVKVDPVTFTLKNECGTLSGHPSIRHVSMAAPGQEGFEQRGMDQRARIELLYSCG
jgi:hypothetical protein